MNAVRHPLPAEYRRQIPAGPLFNQVNEVLAGEGLNTICISGKCPNRGECFSRGSLAFMVLGDVCTRHCGFCAVKAGRPDAADAHEPEGRRQDRRLAARPGERVEGVGRFVVGHALEVPGAIHPRR